MTKEKSTVEDFLKMVNDPQNIYTAWPDDE